MLAANPSRTSRTLLCREKALWYDETMEAMDVGDRGRDLSRTASGLWNCSDVTSEPRCLRAEKLVSDLA